VTPLKVWVIEDTTYLQPFDITGMPNFADMLDVFNLFYLFHCVQKTTMCFNMDKMRFCSFEKG
jgi:hypothetical protein